MMAAVFGRLDSLQEQVDSLARQRGLDRQEIQSQIDELVTKEGLTAEVAYLAAVPTLLPALPPVHFCRRPETVATLISVLAQKTWLELNGDPGAGKSELARLAAEAGGGIRAWLDLRGLQQPGACVALDAAARSVAGDFPPSGLSGAYETFVDKVGAGILVVDDLPMRNPGDPFSKRVLALIAACVTRQVSLITTSLIPPPTWLLERIPSNRYTVQLAPPFTDNEAKELFQQYRAPKSWLAENVISTINGTARGHPVLLIAGIRYLQNRNWKVTEDEFFNFILGSFTSDVKRESAQRLVQLIEDSESRELLYRANLAFSKFSETDVLNLATVDKAIARPQERLQQLVDVCIQRTPDHKLRVSPLFKILGTADVPASTAAGCHSLLGKSIMKRKNIGILDATEAISHLSAAGEHNHAALVLLRALMSMNEYKGKVDPDLLILFWHDKPMPESIDVGLQMLIRANQASLYFKTGKSTTYALTDLDSLSEKAGKNAGKMDAAALLISGITVQQVLAAIDVHRANRFLMRSLRAFSAAAAELPKRLKKQMPHLVEMLWANARNIVNVSDLDDWIANVDSLPAQERDQLFDGKIADDGCWHTADRVWLAEAEKPDSQQDWASIFASLSRFEQAGRRWNRPILSACAYRSQIVVQAEYQKDMTGAEALASECLKSPRFVGKTAYPIRECMGRQFIYQKNYVRARPWLEESLRDVGDSWPEKRITTLMNLARMYDAEGAVKYLLEAAAIAEDEPDTSKLELVRIQGELALAYCNLGNLIDCLRAADNSLAFLLATKDEDDKLWRATAATLGHYISYFYSMITDGKPPDAAADGSPFATPHIGILTTVNLKLADWLKDSRLSFLTGMIASTAEFLGQDDIAERRALQSLDFARAKNELLTISSQGTVMAIVLVAADRLSEALDLSLQTTGATKALMILRKMDSDIFATDRTVEQIIGAKPSSAWNEAEYDSILVAIFPIFLRLATHKLNASLQTTALAKEVVAAIDLISQKASDPELWQIIKEIFVGTFITPTSGVALIKLGTEQKEKKRVGLQAMAYLAATLQVDARPEDALEAHLYVFAESRFVMPSDWPVYRRLAIPFVEAYWRQVFNDQAFRFTPPALYRDLFAAAREKPIELRAQAILRLGYEGLRVPIPPSYREWLAGS